MSKDIAILGVGMHPWGKWGKNFVEYGVEAARTALADAGVNWKDSQCVSGAATKVLGVLGEQGHVGSGDYSQQIRNALKGMGW